MLLSMMAQCTAPDREKGGRNSGLGEEGNGEGKIGGGECQDSLDLFEGF